MIDQINYADQINYVETELDRLSKLRIAYRGAFALAVVVSLVANWLSAHGGTSPKLFSLIAPIALLVVVEMLLQPRPREHRSKFQVVVLALVPGSIALFAATVSFGHIRAVAIEYGQPVWAATLLPLVIDGLAVVANMLAREVHEATSERNAEVAQLRTDERQAARDEAERIKAEAEAQAEAERRAELDRIAAEERKAQRAKVNAKRAAKTGNKKDQEKALKLLDEGHTHAEVAEKVGRSTKTIGRWAKAAVQAERPNLEAVAS